MQKTENDKIRMTRDYNQNSHCQKNTILNSLGRIIQCVKDMINTNPDRFQKTEIPFSIADLGCADGANSVPIFDSLITLIREVNPDLPIQVFLNDTPMNDFTTAMQRISTGLEKHSNVWIYSLGKSFYESLFPENSMDLIFSTASAHWIPRSPAPLTLMNCYLTDEFAATPEGKIWEKEADQYWKSFLELRHKELRRNGRLFIIVPGMSDPSSEDDVRFINQSLIWKSSFIKALKKFDLPADDNYILTAVLRPLKHYKKVFDSEITGMQLLETFSTTHEQVEGDQDPTVYTGRLVNWVRAVSAEILKSKMIQKGIREEVAREVLDEYYNKELMQSLLETDDPQKPLKVYFIGLVMKK